MPSIWNDILDQIQQTQANARAHGVPLWFRGQRIAEWPLSSSLHRRVEKQFRASAGMIPSTEKVDLLHEVYKSLYRKYKARAWHLLSGRELSDWGLVFSMQHHGIPTRLLDWTESFACALYFAHDQRRPSDDAALFMLSPEDLNGANFGHRAQIALGENVTASANAELSSYHPGYVYSYCPLHTIAVAPVLSNARMVAQQSTFTLSGDSFISLEEKYPQHIQKIILPAKTYFESSRFLELLGIGDFKYYPDLQGLRQELISQLDSEEERFQRHVDNYFQPKLPETGA